MFHIDRLRDACSFTHQLQPPSKRQILIQCFMQRIPTKLEKQLFPEKAVSNVVILQLVFDCNCIRWDTPSCSARNSSEKRCYLFLLPVSDYRRL